ncbi:MAG TPA: hypothetical protein VGB97_01270 [Candidatus Paceibacterota bacterium]
MVFQINDAAEAALRDVKRRLGTLDDSVAIQYALSVTRTILPLADENNVIAILTAEGEAEVHLNPE